MTDVYHRINMTRTRAGKLHSVWKEDSLWLKLKLRLHVSGVCLILCYDSESWHLDESVKNDLREVNAIMLSHIIVRYIRDENHVSNIIFDFIYWIRARRLQWLDCILRLLDHRLLKKTMTHLCEHHTDEIFSWTPQLHSRGPNSYNI